jgi:hypothetical protein
MSSSSCATCAQPYASSSTPTSEKPLFPGRHLPCCNRSICARCLNQNKRYETYCPYCQISTAPSSLPQGLHDPPPYAERADYDRPPPISERGDGDFELPGYDESSKDVPFTVADEKAEEDSAPDVLHFVSPDDTVLSLALAYGVPMNVLRKVNSVYSDHLLQARRTVLIPGSHYKGGVSLSPKPLESEEEEIRKGKVRRWMMAVKVAECVPPVPSFSYTLALSHPWQTFLVFLSG